MGVLPIDQHTVMTRRATLALDADPVGFIFLLFNPDCFLFCFVC